VTSRLSGLESGRLDWKTDAVGHGTHCSGTIAAAMNGLGVVGVAPDAEIYTVKVFSDNGAFAYGEYRNAELDQVRYTSMCFFFCFSLCNIIPRLFHCLGSGAMRCRRLQHCFDEFGWT
jgi:hypothetical protein